MSLPKLILKIVQKKLILIVLVLAIIAGSAVRLWKLTAIPFPPSGDELAFGYYGWSLLHFHTDEYGTFLPLYFPSVGDYKYPTLAYLNMIPAFIFGLSEVTVRFWSVIAGIGLIPLTFVLSQLLFRSTIISLASAWFSALSPWSISLSRYGYENNVAVALTTLGVILLLLFAHERSKTKLILSFILFLLSVFCYGTQRVFIPLLLFSLLLISYFKDLQLSKIRKQLFIMFAALTIVITISLIPWQSRGRASGVLWREPSAEELNDLQQSLSVAKISPTKFPGFTATAFHNQILLAATSFLERYSSHFESKFLFLKGGRGVEKIPDSGQLLFIQTIFLPLGLITLLINSRFRNGALISLAWFFTAPIASSLTHSAPDINRSSIMIPALSIISGFGFTQLISIFKNKLLKNSVLGLLIIIVFLNFLYTTYQLFVIKPFQRPWIREQVDRQMSKEIWALKGSYKAVVISNTDNQYMYLLFYQKITPQNFLTQSEITTESQTNQWRRVNWINNINFKMPYECPKGGKLNVLYICTGMNVPQNSKVLKIIRYSDGVPAYTFIEFYPLSQIPEKLPVLPDRLSYMVEKESSSVNGNILRPDGIIPDTDPNFW